MQITRDYFDIQEKSYLILRQVLIFSLLFLAAHPVKAIDMDMNDNKPTLEELDRQMVSLRSTMDSVRRSNKEIQQRAEACVGQSSFAKEIATDWVEATMGEVDKQLLSLSKMMSLGAHCEKAKVQEQLKIVAQKLKEFREQLLRDKKSYLIGVPMIARNFSKETGEKFLLGDLQDRIDTTEGAPRCVGSVGTDIYLKWKKATFCEDLMDSQGKANNTSADSICLVDRLLEVGAFLTNESKPHSQSVKLIQGRCNPATVVGSI